MTSEFLVNEHIRARTVRLLDGDHQVGVLSFHDALAKARNQSLDLVVVAQGANPGDPPICRILDADRFRFEKKKTEKELARRQREMVVNTKEIQLRPVTDENDIAVKARKAKGFLEEGDKVKVVVRFKGRERSHKDWGRHMIEKFLQVVGDHKIDRPLYESDSDMTIVLGSQVSKIDLMKTKSA